MDFQNIWFQLSWIGLNLTLILVIRYSAGKFQMYLQTLSNFCQQIATKCQSGTRVSIHQVHKLSEIVMWLHQIYDPIMQNSQCISLDGSVRVSCVIVLRNMYYILHCTFEFCKSFGKFNLNFYQRVVVGRCLKTG